MEEEEQSWRGWIKRSSLGDLGWGGQGNGMDAFPFQEADHLKREPGAQSSGVLVKVNSHLWGQALMDRTDSLSAHILTVAAAPYQGCP